MIGVVSYLLINFWFTRIQANKAAILAFTMNRVGDMGLSIGFFALIALLGSLNYSTLFSLIPFMNSTAIDVIGILLLSGAMAKSAQIPLHSWLPGSMEGLKIITYFIFFIYISYFHYTNHYEIYLSILPILKTIPNQTLYTITGNLLGDGSISLNKKNREGKYSMTMDTYSLNYLNHLFDSIYSQYSSAGIKGYPNLLLPQHKGKQITQYHFSTKSHPLFTALHGIWYKWSVEENKFIKIVPLNILELFSEISLAY